ncbi:hypothetical protein PV11_09416 [Exophiala sideris]|uniref:Uncharacterized protein n=1 Tax=Exophiala sideris TaxID=1016849 RepID=A0A0D1YRR5_9EURO|nr:hypothetical protein PV11_09416 [Exophiala sideris]
MDLSQIVSDRADVSASATPNQRRLFPSLPKDHIIHGRIDPDFMLPADWLTSKNKKWRVEHTEALEELLLAKNFFKVDVLNTRSKAEFKSIADSLKPYFTIETWTDLQTQALRDKVATKMKRIRADLVVKGRVMRQGDNYTVVPEPVKVHGADSISARRTAELRQYIRSLSEEDRQAAFEVLVETWDLPMLTWAIQKLRSATSSMRWSNAQPGGSEAPLGNKLSWVTSDQR